MEDGTILVVNPGSSSLKLSLLGPQDNTIKSSTSAPDPLVELPAFMGGVPAPSACGVRVVHGGSRFRSATLVDQGVMDAMSDLSELAPLHNPPAVAALKYVRQAFPDLPLVACFDTTFFADLPAAAATYAIPRSWTEDWGIRRFGFHGLSHTYAGRRAAEMVGRRADELRVVTCHLGAGASIAAINHGVAVDTTMGFTPMEGLVMATRSGSIDPGALLWVLKTKGLSAEVAERALDRESGILGVSGVSSAMPDVLQAAAEGNPRAALAIDLYIHRLRALIASMAAAMDGLDVLVFTGGVGENAVEVRGRAADGLAFLGVSVDQALNRDAVADADISTPGSRVRSLVIAAREDLEVARQVRQVLAGA